ncbi:MAG TPA: IS110 family transposase [Ktedonobacteraceae bacterium]|nr:IS110 family transposase [Ktedonobacteraceae bacterium]
MRPKHPSDTVPTPLAQLGQEMLYVGVDIGKQGHVAGFLSATLLLRHRRFEHCPALSFENSREGFHALIERIQTFVPLTQVQILLEVTGHYHRALMQYLQDLMIPVYILHVQKRPEGLLKSDKRDALNLANMLFNQLEKGIQVSDPLQAVRQLLPATEAATQLRGLIQHHAELVRESTQRTNKLPSICDELFPELTRLLRNPNLPTALALRSHFPTPALLAQANFIQLREARGKTCSVSNAKLLELQRLAGQSIGVTEPARVRGLVLAQSQLIAELNVLEEHQIQLEAEIIQIVEASREGKILTSLTGIGPMAAAMLIAAIGNIANFERAAQLKSYFGWVPKIAQSGRTRDWAGLTPRGVRHMKWTMYLVVWRAIQWDSEWKEIYERLLPRTCRIDERTHRLIGREKVIGRLAGQMTSVIYSLLKQDHELLARTEPGKKPPEPTLDDREIHHQHRTGHYRFLRNKQEWSS